MSLRVFFVSLGVPDFGTPVERRFQESCGMHITSSGRCQGEAPGTREPTNEPDSWCKCSRSLCVFC